MKLILQRVTSAQVAVDNTIVGSCQKGFCILVGISENDTASVIDKMANRIVNLRVFEDENGKMNKSLVDIQGSILLVSQFTLLADCNKGRRPSFIGAGNPVHAKNLFDTLILALRQQNVPVETGVFGADMQVEIHNDGPATFILEA